MSCANAVISSVIHRTPSLLFTGGFFVRENKYTIYVALNILIMYLVVVMKTNTNKYTQEEAYELSLRWMPRINKNLSTQWEIETLAGKIWSGEVTISDLEKIKISK